MIYFLSGQLPLFIASIKKKFSTYRVLFEYEYYETAVHMLVFICGCIFFAHVQFVVRSAIFYIFVHDPLISFILGLFVLFGL